MAMKLIRAQVRIHSAGLIDHAKETEIPGWEIAVDRLIGELVCAFFIAMAVMEIVTTVAGVFG